MTGRRAALSGAWAEAGQRTGAAALVEHTSTNVRNGVIGDLHVKWRFRCCSMARRYSPSRGSPQRATTRPNSGSRAGSGAPDSAIPIEEPNRCLPCRCACPALPAARACGTDRRRGGGPWQRGARCVARAGDDRYHQHVLQPRRTGAGGPDAGRVHPAHDAGWCPGVRAPHRGDRTGGRAFMDDTTWYHARTLAPIAHRSHSTNRSFSIDYAPGRVTGLPQGLGGHAPDRR